MDLIDTITVMDTITDMVMVMASECIMIIEHVLTFVVCFNDHSLYFFKGLIALIS